MPILAKFTVEPIEALGYCLYESMISNKNVSDLFHIFYTLKKLQDDDFISDFVEIPDEGGILFLKMNEPRYKLFDDGSYLKQGKYLISDQRLEFLISKVDVWTELEKQQAKTYYKSYHGTN